MFQQVISCSSFLKQPRKRAFAALSEQETGQGCRTPGGFETCATRIKSDEEQKSRGKTAIRLARSTPGHVPAAEAEWAKSSRPGRRAWEQPPAGTVVLRQKRLGMGVCILLICMIFHAMTMHWSELNSERGQNLVPKITAFRKGLRTCVLHATLLQSLPLGEDLRERLEIFRNILPGILPDILPDILPGCSPGSSGTGQKALYKSRPGC